MAAQGAVPAQVPQAPDVDDMEQALIWIGVDDAAKRLLMIGAFGDDLDVFEAVSLRNVEDVLKDLAAHTRNNERVRLPLKQKTLFLGIYHWVQDVQVRLNEEVSLEDHDEASFRAAVTESFNSAKIRAAGASGREDRAKAASPGTLKKESDWAKWEIGICNMLSILHGINGFPLIYIWREKNHEEGDTYSSFDQECIAKAPLEGAAYEADAKVGHEIILNLTTGENAEQWIRQHRKNADGRLDMTALRAHFRGAGNTSRRIAVAVDLHKTLHYRNERAMSFSLFLSKAKEMWEIYRECEEVKTDKEQLRWLFDSIKDPALSVSVESLRIAINQDEAAYTFSSAADFLASVIKPASTSRSGLSSVGTEGDSRGTEAPSSGVMVHGKVFHGTYSRQQWNALTGEEKQSVLAARKEGGPSRARSSKSHRGGNSGKTKDQKKIAQVQKKNAKLTRQIKALKRSKDAASDSDSDSESDSAPAANAGDSFGGRSNKQKQKKKRHS